MMKKPTVLFEEQKSEYMNPEKENSTEYMKKEDSSMNKMLTQVVIIGFIGVILLFLIFQVFTNRKNIEDENVAKGLTFELSKENQVLLNGVKDVEKSVQDITSSKDVNIINQGTMAFIRKDKYGYNVNGMTRFIWSRFAGTMDQEAGINRDEHVEEVEKISELVNDLNILTNPINDYDIDFKHLVTVIDLELTDTSSVEYEDEYYDYLFSWAGDLETFFIDMGKYKSEYPEANDEELYTYARKTIGSLERSYFSREDLLADIDGVNISMLMKEEDLLLSEAINSYYTKGLFTSRYSLFIDSFGGEESFREKVVSLMYEEIEGAYLDNEEFISYYDNVIGLKNLMSVFMNQSNYEVSSQMKDAAIKAFIDIILENYGLESFEKQLQTKK